VRVGKVPVRDYWRGESVGGLVAEGREDVL